MHDLNNRLSEALGEVVVLYVEDEDEVRMLASKYISRSIPNLLVAGSGEEALRVSEGKEVDILVTDINMGAMDGAELASKIKDRNPSCYIIFSTAYSNTDCLMQAVDIKIDKYMVKPVDWKELVNTIAVFAERVFMMKHLREEMESDGVSFISDDVYKDLNGALACIDEGISSISKENSTENTVKSIRSLETARKYIENVLKDSF